MSKDGVSMAGFLQHAVSTCTVHVAISIAYNYMYRACLCFGFERVNEVIDFEFQTHVAFPQAQEIEAAADRLLESL